MSIEVVRRFFKSHGIENRVQEFDVSSATVELAAEALNCEPCRIAKTLSFMADGRPVLELIGHGVGGVCPFAVNEGVDIYLDISLKRFETVFPACGSSNSAIELTIEELEKYSSFIAWIDVCKNWQVVS